MRKKFPQASDSALISPGVKWKKFRLIVHGYSHSEFSRWINKLGIIQVTCDNIGTRAFCFLALGMRIVLIFIIVSATKLLTYDMLHDKNRYRSSLSQDIYSKKLSTYSYGSQSSQYRNIALRITRGLSKKFEIRQTHDVLSRSHYIAAKCAKRTSSSPNIESDVHNRYLLWISSICGLACGSL